MKKKSKINIGRIILVALALRLLLIFTPPHVDVLNHLDWGIKFWQYGPKDFYEQIFWGVSWPNQPIGSILLFAAVAKIYQFIFQALWHLNLKIAIFPSFIFPFVEKNFHLILLKLPFVLADLGIGILVYKIVKDLLKKEKLALLGSGLFLFNPALIYNSTIWGQTDSLVNLLGLLGIWGIWKKKYFWGILTFLGSLYFKLSLIIFTPLLVFMLWQRRKDWRKIIVSGLFASGFFLLISLPFVHHGNVFSWLWYLCTNRVLPRQGEMLSGNAFNFWTLLYGIDLSLNEKMSFLGLTAKFWGRMFSLLAAGVATLLWVINKKKTSFLNYLWLGIFYAFSVFLFLTNMHERYLYPVFPLLAVLAARNKNFLKIYLALSVIYLLNLYNLWWYPRCEFLVVLLSGFNNFLPRLLSLVNIGIFVILLRQFYYEKKLA